MEPIEIIVIISSVLIVGGVITKEVYRKVKKLPSSECACCKSNMKRAIKKMKKDINKQA